MGLLDDAIREHLDLKRRRGADPSEIAKEEADALGPVRRDAPPEDEPPGPAAGHHEAAALDEPAVVYDDDPFAEDDDDRLVASEPPATHDHIWAEPAEESREPPQGDPLAHQHTREFSATELGEALGQEEPGGSVPADAFEPPASEPPAAAEAPAAEDDEADADADDELEETPDFLQETPEHDRLWFEQKPPKDFDF